MKDSATIQRATKSVNSERDELEDLMKSKVSFGIVEIEVEVVDKFIPNILVDDGSSVNIMPAFIMEHLGLAITHPPTSFVI
jgi:hypothetical protein